MGPVLGPHAGTDRTRDTRDAEPWLPAPEDGRLGEGQRLTTAAPHNGGRPPPPGMAPHHPRGTQPPRDMQAKGTVLGPHTHTPGPTAHGRRTPTARPMGGQLGEGQRLTSDAPHNGGRHPPRGRPSATPTASNAGPQGRTLGAGAGSPRPHRPHPGHTGRGTLAARSRGRAAEGGTAPDTRGTAPHHPRGMQPPQDMQAEGTVLGPHTYTPAPTARGWRTPTARPAGGQSGEGRRLASVGRRHPPRGRPPATPTASNARAHAVEPVLGPHTRTDRTRDTRVAEPWLPTPEEGQSGEGQRLTSDAPQHGGRRPPFGDALPPPPQRATPARKGTRCGAGAGPPRPHRPRPGHVGHGTLAARSRGRPGEGQRLTPDAPRNAGKRPPPGTPIRHPHNEQRTNAPTHQPRDIRTPPPALRHSDTTMAEPAAPRKTRPRSPTLEEAHEVIRALGLRDGEGDPPQGDAGTDSDLEAVPEPPTGGAPAEPAPPAGSVPALCPAWKRGHCTGEGWCPKQQKPAAACAALRYGVAQGWILDETGRRSVNIQEAVDRVTHAGQAAVALHTRGCHGGPAEGIILEPSGMVLVLAADMVRGVLHASRVRRACPQWTVQVYTPPRAWPFSTWAVLAVMWHLATEDAPTGTAEDIPWDLHSWPADQDYPWCRPRGGLPVAPAAEGLSLAPTLQRHPDKKARHFLQTGTVPATPPDSEWRWDAGVAQPLPGPWALPLWYLPMGTLAHATQAVKGAFPQPLLPGVALLRSLQAGAAWVRWKEGKGRSSPYFPLVQGQALIHAEGMGTVEWGAIVPGTACRWITAAAPQPMRSLPACHRLLRMVPSLAPQHAFTRNVWKAVLSHTREWLTNPGARYPPGPVLEQLTAPTSVVLHALHRASALTEQLNDEVLDLALEPLRVLYPQTHIPPAGTSNRLGRLGLQRRVEAAHPGGVVEQLLTLRNPSTAAGHWYLPHLPFQPRAAPEHRWQNPYHTHQERRGAQDFPQPVPPALPPGQGPEALQQGPRLDTATTVQLRGHDGADGAEPDVTNCGALACMAACRHLARDTTGLRQYRPTDRTALASAVAAVTMGPVAAWPAQLLPHVPCRDTQPRRPAARHAPTATLTAEQLYVVAAALLADGG